MADSFNVPTQVAYYDIEEDNYIAGIAYGDKIICLCCGGVIDIPEFLSDVEKTCPAVQFPIIPLSWENLNECCLGDAMFDSWTGEMS